MAATTQHSVMALSLDKPTVIIKPTNDTDSLSDQNPTSDLSFSFADEQKAVVDRRFDYLQKGVFLVTCLSLSLTTCILFNNYFTGQMARLNGHFTNHTSSMAVAAIVPTEIEAAVEKQELSIGNQPTIATSTENTNSTTTITTSTTTIKTPGRVPASTEKKADLDFIVPAEQQAMASESAISQAKKEIKKVQVSAALPFKANEENVVVEKRVDWNRLKQAALIANKPILLRFGAPWCTPCKIMEKSTFTNPILKAFLSDHYLSQKIDVSTKEGKALQQLYGIEQIPTMVFYSPQANILERHQGTITSTKLLEKLGEHVGYNEKIDINYLNNRSAVR